MSIEITEAGPTEADLDMAARFYCSRALGSSKADELKRLRVNLEDEEAALDSLVYLFMQHRLAALQAREEETAWLIERHDYTPGLHYYAEYPNGDHYWTPDHLKAMRFATEADARVIAKDDPLLTVAEHMWVANPQAREDVGESAEPVAWMYRTVHGEGAYFSETRNTTLAANAPPDGEWIETPLYTHPTPAELPGDALRAAFKLAASQIERDVRLSELTDGEIDALVRAVRG